MSLKNNSSYKFLLATQFLGILNDNIFKLAVSFLVAKYGAKYLSIGQNIFIIPFILFSFHAGWIADRYNKAKIIKITKIIEVIIMTLALIFFTTKNIPVLFTILFFMGLQSTLFSPSKYGILPEMLKINNLTKGNSYLEIFAHAAILTGTAIAGILISLGGTGPDNEPSYYVVGIFVFVISLLGLVTSSFIKHDKIDSKNVPFSLNPIPSILKTLKEIASHRGLFLVLIGTAYFFLLGSIFQLNILLFAKNTLLLNETYTGLLIASLVVGIAVGAVLAGKVSEGKVEIGLVPIGALGIGFSCICLWLFGHNIRASYFFLFLLGISSGLFLIPQNSYMQIRSPQDSLGRYIAVNNICHFVAMFIANTLFWLLIDIFKLTPSSVFLFMGILTFLVTIYLFKILPEIMIRCINWILIHTFYRVSVSGQEFIPKKGGALIVANHITYIDASLLLAVTERRISYLMYKPYYQKPIVNFFAKSMEAIPIAGGKEMSKAEKEQALNQAKKIIKNGRIVGIFAEGGLTRSGEIEHFRPGMEKIMENLDAPIIPVKLEGLWGSMFSYKDGKPLFKLPKKIPYPVSITFGEPLSADTKAKEVQSIIEGL